MSLVWHIVRKDLRRLWLPLTLWLVMGLAQTALLTTYLGNNLVDGASYEGLRYFAVTTGMMVTGVGFVLAAWLVMEDSLVNTGSFWSTRPISGARLLVAKILGAILMFSVAPVLVMTAVWFACGFTIDQWSQAAWDLAARQGLAASVAFVIAAVTATSGQFLMRAVGAAVVIPLGINFALGELFSSEAILTTGVIMSRTSLVWAILVSTLPIVVLHQFLTRRTVRSWVLGGLGFGLMLMVRFGWFWDITPWIPSPGPRDGGSTAEIRGIVPEAKWTNSSRDLNQPARRQISQGGMLRGIPAGAYLLINPSVGEWVSGKVRLPLLTRLRNPATDRRPPEFLVRQLAGLPGTDPSEASWRIEGAALAEQTEMARADGSSLETTLNLTLMRGHLLGELPLRVGAELSVGACRTSIIGVERVDGKMVVRLEDRDASADLPTDSSAAGIFAPPRRSGEDGFALKATDGSFTQVPAVREVGAVRINSIIISQRELVLDPPTQEVNGRTVETPDWEEQAVLIQVRFKPETTFTRTLRANPFAS